MMSEIDQCVQELMDSLNSMPPTMRYYVFMVLSERIINEIPNVRKEAMDELKKQQDAYKKMLKSFVEAETKENTATDEGEVLYEDKEN